MTADESEYNSKVKNDYDNVHDNRKEEKQLKIQMQDRNSPQNDTTLANGNLKKDENSQAQERDDGGTIDDNENIDDNDEQGYQIL